MHDLAPSEQSARPLQRECRYARRRPIAISPVNPLPHKTQFHEVTHVLLGHTQERDQTDVDHTPETYARSRQSRRRLTESRL
jgi:hypothetical protein